MLKTKTSALSKVPTKTPVRAKKIAVPKPLRGTKNRYSYQSISPAEAMEYASLAHGLELDFGNDEKAMRWYRSRLYTLNKEFSGKWRFRTIREGNVLMIWRLAY